MGKTAKADFSGYATKANLVCSDGRTIMPNAFAEQHGTQVPMIWKHQHDDPSAVLGHAILEARDDGMYTYCFFNNSPKAKDAHEAVRHGDINQMSIYANRLVQSGKKVLHGAIREVSLVLGGANPGALIDNVAIRHADGDEDLLDEAIITTGLVLAHSDEGDQEDDVDQDDVDQEDDKEDEDDSVSHADEDEDDDEDFDLRAAYESMTPAQKRATDTLVGAAAAVAIKHEDEDDDAHLDHQEGNRDMSNIFDQTDAGGKRRHTISHDDMSQIMRRAQATGLFSEAVKEYADEHLEHGIEDIEILFPDAKNVAATPEWLARRPDWVAEVMDGARHVPFSRIRTQHADLTPESARAKGYVKGTMKREEFFKVARRVTTPTTIYKKQKLDRDDVLDITDFDVVVWIKGEMRFMMNEEIARAILLGDGRSHESEDKIDEEKIRPILRDHELFVTRVNVNVQDAGSSYEELVDAAVLERRHYRGSGNPVFFTRQQVLSNLLLTKDTLGRRIYPTAADLAAAMGVSKVIAVEAMEEEAYADVLGIMVNMKDYTIGADKGGELNMFDDFDIDYNQYKYLLETRISGCLTKVKSALVFFETAADSVQVTAYKPKVANNVITIPTDKDQHYVSVNGDGSDGETLTETVTLSPSKPKVTVRAIADTGHHFSENATDEWTYEYKA